MYAPSIPELCRGMLTVLPARGLPDGGNPLGNLLKASRDKGPPLDSSEKDHLPGFAKAEGPHRGGLHPGHRPAAL